MHSKVSFSILFLPNLDISMPFSVHLLTGRVWTHKVIRIILIQFKYCLQWQVYDVFLVLSLKNKIIVFIPTPDNSNLIVKS